MAVKDATTSELIRKVVSEARKQRDKAGAREAQTFIQLYFANSPIQDLAGFKPADLAALAMHHFSLATNRAPGKALVRVYNPTLKANGYESDHTIIEICNDDMPFLVDSIASEVTRRELDIHQLIHPIIQLRRTKSGKFSEFVEAGASGSLHESFMRLEITRQSGDRLEEIKTRFEQILDDIRNAVEDWRPMRERMGAIIEEFLAVPKGVATDEASEARDFMRWIHDNNFTFLGFREYDLKGSGKQASALLKKESGLGVLRNSSVEVFDEIDRSHPLHMEVRAFLRNAALLRRVRRSSVWRNPAAACA